MEALHHMFVLGLPWFEKLARPIVVYLLLLLLLRLFGKRELAQLNPFDLIVLLCLSNTLQNAIIGDDTSVTGGVLGAFALLSINYVTLRFLYRRPKLQERLEGCPTILMEHGKLRPEAMRQEVLTAKELRLAVHRLGFNDLADLDQIALEPAGTFSVHAKPKPADRTDEILARLAAIEQLLAKKLPSV
ncbi:MAG: DUF421 domain-containing protein [Bryobacteraceae bacterium]|nr:DUF421 domain-containing protein [Bryobacteraceae bacterium]